MAKADKLRALGAAAAGVAALVQPAEEEPSAPNGLAAARHAPVAHAVDHLFRFNVSLPMSVVERLKDEQYHLRHVKRKVSLSGLVEVAMRTYLDLPEADRAAAVDRYRGRARRDMLRRPEE